MRRDSPTSNSARCWRSRVACCASLCRWISPLLFLTPHMAEFCRRYPGISFDFDLTPRRVDLVAEPFDVAIRMGELPDQH